jgi:lantibiotic biosynthesis protein
MNPLSVQALTALKIDEIAQSIAFHEDQIKGTSYSNGKLGLALFYLYYGQYKADPTYADKAEQLLIDAFQAIINEPSNGRFFHKNLAELGTFIEFTKENQWFDFDDSTILNQVDEAITEHLKLSIDVEDFDTFSGALVGGQYFVNRFQSKPSVIQQISFFLKGLEEKANNVENGAFWYAKFMNPSGDIYLGISHGIAAIIICLTQIHELNIETNTCKKLIKKATNFLLSQQKNYDEEKHFFSNVVGVASKPSQIRLCYGDLGVGYALLKAANILKDKTLLNTAYNILRVSAEQNIIEDTQDAGILYGTAGVSLFYDKVFRITKQPFYYTVSDLWYKKTLQLGKIPNNFAGYEPQYNRKKIDTYTSFFEGIAGIGCSFIQKMDKTMPHLDKLVWLN